MRQAFETFFWNSARFLVSEVAVPVLERVPQALIIVMPANAGQKYDEMDEIRRLNPKNRPQAAANQQADTDSSDATSTPEEETKKDEKALDDKEEGKKDGHKSGFPDRPLPRNPRNDRPAPEPDAEVAHTQLGQKEGRRGKYDQAREFDADGKPVRDIDFTDHGRPQNHTNPHQHRYVPNPTGGTLQHGPAEPLQY